MQSLSKDPFAGVDFRGKRTSIVSLGCARNSVDSEVFLSAARRKGAILCDTEEAEIILVNTCAFTQDAKKESIDCILDLLKFKGRNGKARPHIIVLGCLAKRYENELSQEIKEIEVIPRLAGFKGKDFLAAPLSLGTPHSAYIKIAEGCDNSCTFCAIPEIKGSLKNRSEQDILDEAGYLEKQGTKELNIIGQDITLYGVKRNTGRSLPLVGLLKKILKATSIPWIRLLYLHPKRVPDELLEFMATEKRICPYIDIPLQHINDRILKLMGRQMKRRDAEKLIQAVRRRLPGAAIRTAFIAGFPSETDKEFRELLDFIKETEFDKLGVFPYSREEGTLAYRLKKQISEQEKIRRQDELMLVQKKISRKLLKRKIGEKPEVLVDENTADDTIALGRTPWDAPEVDGVIRLRCRGKLMPGELVACRITDSYDYDLSGECL